MTTVRTLADPLFNSIINKGETTMNNETTAIDCQTTEEWTEERKQAFEKASAYTPSTTDINPSVDSVSTSRPIQGVTGAVYAPMDTSPQPKESRLDQLTTLLNETLKQLVIELNKQTQPDLPQAVETTLENAQWFRDMVEETCADRVSDLDFEYEINNAVEQEMRSFDPNDHVDFDDLVSDAVEDRLESIVAEKLEELLEEKLKNATVNIRF